MIGGSFKVRKSEDNGTPTSTPTTTPTATTTPTPTLTTTPTPTTTPTTTSTEPAGSFNYVYKLLDLEYIQNIGHHIYNSNYDIN